MEHQSVREPPEFAVAPDTIAYARELRALYRAAEQRAVRFRLLVEMSRDLMHVRDTDALLRLALVRVTTFSAYDTGAVLLGAEGGELALRAALQLSDPAAQIGLPPGVRDQAQRAFRQGDIVLHHDDAAPAAGAPPAQIFLPLLPSDGTPLGVLALTDATTQMAPDADDLDALQLLTAQLAAALQNAQLYEAKNQLVHRLTEREARLAELVDQLMRAQEEERRRVAYDIHDGLAQMILGVLQQLRTLTDRFKPRSPAARQALERAVQMTQATVDEARRVIAGLRPTVLDDFGLARALQLLAQTLQTDGRQVEYTESLGTERLPAALETALYRIAQEALSNIRKHAGPTPIAMTLSRRDRHIQLTIQDWGCGFVPEAAGAASDAGAHVGLASINERVSLLNGGWRLQSSPGNGTLVEVVLPLTPPIQEGEADG